MIAINTIINLFEWIEENQCSFQPPVCNFMLSNGQLKVFLVGGPNKRLDYHINEGEEFFFMIKGDMVLKVVEQGKHKDVVIREGHSFLLNPRIPHSPQRPKDTIGLVIERERLLHELDGLRFYVNDSSTDVLYEKWFHCFDLVGQLKPLIEEFFASEEFRQRTPSKEVPAPPYETDNKTRVMTPINVSQWLQDPQIGLKMKKEFFPLFSNSNAVHKTIVGFYGPGIHTIETPTGTEQFLWQWEDDGTILQVGGGDLEGKSQKFCVNHVIILGKGTTWQLTNRPEAGVTFSLLMPVKINDTLHKKNVI